MLHKWEPKFYLEEKKRMLRYLGFHWITVELFEPTPKGQTFMGLWTHDYYGGHFTTKEAIKLVKGENAEQAKNIKYPIRFTKQGSRLYKPNKYDYLR